LWYRASMKRSFRFSFLILRHSAGLHGRGINPSQGRYLTQTQNKCKQTFMARVEFELTIPVFERAKHFMS
jgi:hypothetical protein